MGLEVRFARDAQGKPTAASPPPVEAVGAFFEREVGPDPGLGDWVLEAIDDVLTGREVGAPEVGTNRNHSSVTIDTSFGGFVEVCCDLGESGGPYQDVQRMATGRSSGARSPYRTSEPRWWTGWPSSATRRAPPIR